MPKNPLSPSVELTIWWWSATSRLLNYHGSRLKSRVISLQRVLQRAMIFFSASTSLEGSKIPLLIRCVLQQKQAPSSTLSMRRTIMGVQTHSRTQREVELKCALSSKLLIQMTPLQWSTSVGSVKPTLRMARNTCSRTSTIWLADQ